MQSSLRLMTSVTSILGISRRTSLALTSNCSILHVVSLRMLTPREMCIVSSESSITTRASQILNSLMNLTLWSSRILIRELRNLVMGKRLPKVLRCYSASPCTKRAGPRSYNPLLAVAEPFSNLKLKILKSILLSKYP